MSSPTPGWYPDPNEPGAQRWWDGTQWTTHQQRPQPSAPGPSADANQWAMIAHLSALIGLVIGLSFVGPLIVYAVKKDSHPYVRAQAAEALNFNLSVLIYGAALGLVTVVTIIFLVGIIFIPVLIAGAIAWLVLTIVAAMKANRGEPYRYPLTLRFVS